MAFRKSFYNEYARHCMRFYANYPSPIFKNKIDSYNWKACERSLPRFSENEQKLLIEIYKDYETIPDNVYNIAMREHIEQDDLWKLVEKLEYRVAKKRGLI